MLYKQELPGQLQDLNTLIFAKRLACPQQPNVYLEPKWLRCQWMKQKSSHMLKFFLGDIKHAEQLPGQMGGQFGGIEGKPKLNMKTVNAFFRS